MDIIRISRAALARDGMVKQAEEAVYIRPSGGYSLIRVAHAAMSKQAGANAPAYDPMERIISSAMRKKADAGANWTFSTGASGLRPRKAIGVMAPPKPTPNVNLPKVQPQGNAGVTNVEAYGLGQATQGESMVNNTNAVAAYNAKTNAEKGLQAEVGGNGRWDRGKYVNTGGRQDARRMRRGLTGWWDRLVNRSNDVSDPRTAREVSRGDAIDTRSWWQQIRAKGANDARSFYRPAAMGTYRAPDGYQYQQAHWDKTKGDLPATTETLKRDPNNANVLEADLQYDRQMRTNNLFNHYGLRDDPGLRMKMQNVLRDINEAKGNNEYFDDKGRWTSAALDQFRNSADFQDLQREFMRRNKHMDNSAFFDSVMAEGTNGYGRYPG